MIYLFSQTQSSTNRRWWTLLQLSGIGLLLTAGITFGIVAVANASGPAGGTIVPGSAVPVLPFTTNTPFSSGQMINVVLPAESVLPTTENVNIVECSAPGGVIPTSPTVCDGNTVQADSVTPNADGSFNYEEGDGDLYPVYALPDTTTFHEPVSGPACNLSTECILYIGDNQNDFTQPHFWSQPFFVAPNSDDKGENPGDGSAPVTPTVPSATLSTVVPSPSTAVADGGDTSIVTVTLLGTGSIPIPNKAVTLTTSSSTAKIAGPTPTMTNSSGQVTFNVTDTVAETVPLTATDTTDSLTLTPSPAAAIDFEAPVLSNANSTVSANPTTVPSGSSTTITVTLRDQGTNPQPVAGQSVTLAGTGSAEILPNTPESTGSSGSVTFTATDTANEKVTFSATDVTDSNLLLTSTASVVFGTLLVDPTTSTLTATTPAEVSGAGTEATITLLTAGGSPVSNKTVSITASSSTATVGPSQMTNAEGKAMIDVSDTVAESVKLTAEDTTDTVTLSETATVSFQAPAPSGSVSTISPATATSPADGQTEMEILVTVTDQFGNGLANETVNLQASPSGNVQFHPIAVGSSAPGITGANGEAEFEADDTTAEVVTFTATATNTTASGATNTVTLTGNSVVTYTAGPADVNASTVVATPTGVPADGKTPTTIAVTLNDYFDNPVEGKTIALAALNGSSVIATVSAITNLQGVATFTATDTTDEFVTYQATDQTDKLVLNAQAVVTFGNPPSPPPVAADCSVVSVPSSVPADGTSVATITVLLFDGNGNAVVGKIVTLNPSGGHSKVTTVNGTTDNTGSAVFTVSDTTAESVTYTVTDSTDNVVLTGDTVGVTFTASTGSTTTTTTTTTTTPGSTTTTTAPPSGTTTATSSTTTVPTAVAGTSNGSSDTSSGTGSDLAFTGASTLLPWLIGFGLLFMSIGSLGRRRLREREA